MKKKTKMKMNTKKLIGGGGKTPKPGMFRRALTKLMPTKTRTTKAGNSGTDAAAPKERPTSGAAAKTNKTSNTGGPEKTKANTGGPEKTKVLNAPAGPPKGVAAAAAAPALAAPPKVAAAAAAAASTPAMPKPGAAPVVEKIAVAPATVAAEKTQKKGIVSKAQGMFAAVKAGGMGAVMGKVSGLLGPLQATLSKGIAGAKPLVTKLIKAIPTPMLKALLPPGTPVRLVKMFPGMATSIALKFMPGDMKKQINSVIKPMGKTLKSGVTKVGSKVKGAAKSVKKAAPKSFANAASKIVKAGTSAKSGLSGVASAVTSKMGSAKSGLSGIASAVTSKMGSAKSGLSGLSGAVSAVTSKMGSAKSGLSGAVSAVTSKMGSAKSGKKGTEKSSNTGTEKPSKMKSIKTGISKASNFITGPLRRTYRLLT